MSIRLDKKALEHVKNYKYKTHGLTFIEINAFEYFWNFVQSICPPVRLRCFKLSIVDSS
jgi:hypothetical protein